jgi:hypothetical protein
MEALTAADILDVWEQGASAGGHERALLLLGYARPDLPAATLGGAPIGGRDADLLRLREATFGRRMVAVSPCPSCRETLELDLDAAAIRPEIDATSSPRTVTASVDGRERTVRLPTTDDLVAARAEAAASRWDREVVRRALLTRLLDGGVAPPSPLAEAAVAEALANDDTGTEIRVAVACPVCGHEWDASVDVPAYLWEEVVAAAERLAGEVAGLATAYGWREADVLRLSPWRRRLYLDLASE